jgi:hypothetical protein
MPQNINSLPVEYLFTINATLADPVVIPNGPLGTRVIVPCTGGTFSGPRVSGTIASVGADWLTMRSNGTAQLDVRIILTTDDGASIYMTYTGVMAPGADGPQIVTAPLFQAGDERYVWLNDLQAVAIGKPGQNRVDYEVYKVIG